MNLISMPDGYVVTLNTVGHEIEHTHDMNIPFYGRTPIVVSGCGGPIGVQNHYAAPKANAWKSQDHLKGYGLDWSSGCCREKSDPIS